MALEVRWLVAHLVDRYVRELSIVIERLDREVYVAPRLVGEPLLDQALYRLVDVRYVRRDPGMHVGLPYTERRHVLDVRIDERLCELDGILSLLVRPFYYLVVDVREVLSIDDVEPLALDPSSYDVERHVRPGMTYMAVVVHGGPAHVHAYVVPVRRLELLFLPAECVVHDERHACRSLNKS